MADWGDPKICEPIIKSCSFAFNVNTPNSTKTMAPSGLFRNVTTKVKTPDAHIACFWVNVSAVRADVRGPLWQLAVSRQVKLHVQGFFLNLFWVVGLLQMETPHGSHAFKEQRAETNSQLINEQARGVWGRKGRCRKGGGCIVLKPCTVLPNPKQLIRTWKSKTCSTLWMTGRWILAVAFTNQSVFSKYCWAGQSRGSAAICSEPQEV